MDRWGSVFTSPVWKTHRRGPYSIDVVPDNQIDLNRSCIRIVYDRQTTAHPRASDRGNVIEGRVPLFDPRDHLIPPIYPVLLQQLAISIPDLALGLGLGRSIFSCNVIDEKDGDFGSSGVDSRDTASSVDVQRSIDRSNRLCEGICELASQCRLGKRSSLPSVCALQPAYPVDPFLSLHRPPARRLARLQPRHRPP